MRLCLSEYCLCVKLGVRRLTRFVGGNPLCLRAVLSGLLRCCTAPNCRFIVGLRRCFVKRLPFSTTVLVDSAEVFLYYEKEFCSDVDKTAV